MAKLEMPTFGSSLYKGPEPLGLNPDYDLSALGAGSADGASSGLASAAGVAGPKALADLISGLMKAEMIRDTAKRQVQGQTAVEMAKGGLQAQELKAEGTINPLRALIANYRAMITK